MKYWIIIILLFQINHSSATSDSLYLSLALIEKNIFESDDIQNVNDLLFTKSDIYLQNELNELSIYTLQRIDTTKLSRNGCNEYYLRYAFSLTMNNNFDQAFNELAKITNENEGQNKDKIFLQSFVLNEMELFAESKKMILSDSISKTCLDSSALNLPETISLKNPAKAYRLSGYFPGVGQTYAGNFWKGALSLTLTAGFATFGIYNFTNEFYVMGIVSGLYPGMKFYAGGKKLAEKNAEEENSKKLELLKIEYRKMLYRYRDCNQNMYPMRIDGIR